MSKPRGVALQASGDGDVSGEDDTPKDDSIAKVYQESSLADLLIVPPHFEREFGPDDLDELRETFVAIDTDGSLSLDRTELAAVFGQMGESVTEEKMDELVLLADADGSGEIEFPEFLGLVVALRNDPERFRGFTGLLSAIGDTPQAMLKFLARNRDLVLRYRIAQVVAADAIYGETYVMEARLTGWWTDTTDAQSAKPYHGTKSFQGVATTSRLARRKAAQNALERLQSFIPGLVFRKGVIPEPWFAWVEENLDRGVDSNEVLRILVKKGFVPAKNKRLMQFIAAHESLTVTTTLPVGGGAGAGAGAGGGARSAAASSKYPTLQNTGFYDVTSEKYKPPGSPERPELLQPKGVPVTATIIGSLSDSRNLPPQWTAWLRDNLARGVDGALLLEMLRKHGFDPTQNPRMVQAILQTDKESTAPRRPDVRNLIAKRHSPEKMTAHLKNKREQSVRQVKDRALDFASKRAFVIPDDIEAERDEEGRVKEYTVETDLANELHSTHVATYGVASPKAPPPRHRVDLGVDKLGRTNDPLQHLTDEDGVVLPDPHIEPEEEEHGATYWGAIMRGDLEEVRWYINGGQDPAEPSPYKRLPPIITAVLHRRMEILRMLIAHGCDVNQPDPRRRTALHHACSNGEVDFVTFLVTNGADLFARDTYGDTPMHVAAARGHATVVEFLHTYLEERVLRHIENWQFTDIVGDLYTTMLKEKVTKFGTQNYQLSWVPEAYHRTYEMSHEFHKRFLPAPFDEALELATRRWLPARPKVINKAILLKLIQRAFALSISIPPNKSGRRPLHMAVDPPSAKVTSGHAACVKVLVDTFAAYLPAEDNAGRTAMALLTLRNKAVRPETGARVAAKLSLINEVASGSLVSGDGEHDARSGTPGPAAGEPSTSTVASGASMHSSGANAEALRVLRVAGTRSAKGMRACIWGCRQWIQWEKLQEHLETQCQRRITACKYECGITIREEQWAIIRDRHFKEECTRRPVECSLGCGGAFPEEDIPEHQARTCIKRPAKPLKCPLRCGHSVSGTYDTLRTMERLMDEHVQEDCPKRMVHCNFTGCYDQMRAEQRRDHRARHLRDMGMAQWTTPGKYSFVVPRSCLEVMVQVWGGGGGGGHFKNVRGGNGGGGGYAECIIDVTPNEELSLVVGQGGPKGVHGVTATPLNKLLRRAAIKQETGVAPGGTPGGGDGFAFNSTFASGAGGGYSAVYRKVPYGRQVVALAGGGGGGGTRQGTPGGLAYIIGMNDLAPDEGFGGNKADEVVEGGTAEALESVKKYVESRRSLEEARAAARNVKKPKAVAEGDEEEEEDSSADEAALAGHNARQRRGRPPRVSTSKPPTGGAGAGAGAGAAGRASEEEEVSLYGDTRFGFVLPSTGEWWWNMDGVGGEYNEEGRWVPDTGEFTTDGGYVEAATTDLEWRASQMAYMDQAEGEAGAVAAHHRASIAAKAQAELKKAVERTRQPRVSNASAASNDSEVSYLYDRPIVRQGGALKSQEEIMEQEAKSRALYEALKKSKVTPDGDDLLRNGRSGGLQGGGKGGYDGGFPGGALKGGDGSHTFGAGGGAGLYGGGGGGQTPGMVGGGGGGSSFAQGKPGQRAFCEGGFRRQPGGLSRDPPDATLAGEWDFVGGPAGQGGEGRPDFLSDGNCGAIRIKFKGYYDIRMGKEYKAPVPVIDQGFDGPHPAGIRPNEDKMVELRASRLNEVEDEEPHLAAARQRYRFRPPRPAGPPPDVVPQTVPAMLTPESYKARLAKAMKEAAIPL